MEIKIHEVAENELPTFFVENKKPLIKALVNCANNVVRDDYDCVDGCDFDYIKAEVPNDETFTVEGQYHKMDRQAVLRTIRSIFFRFCGEAVVDFYEAVREDCKVDKLFVAVAHL